MPWLEDVTDERFLELFESRTVGRWPKPDTQRIGGFFRYIQVRGFPSAMASRYFFEFEPFDGEETKLWCWLDLEQVSENRLAGTSGVSPDDREVLFSVNQYRFPEVDPIYGSPGVTWKIEWTRTGFETFYLQFTWPTGIPDDPGAPFTANFRPGSFAPYVVRDNWAETDPKDWTAPFPQQHMRWFSMSECYDIDPPPEDPGFAQGNGVDAYIQLDTFTGNIVNRWEWSGDFFFRSFTSGFALVNGSVSSSISGISATHAYFGTISVPHGGAIPLDEWVKISVERSWQSPTGALMKVFLNDVEVGSAVRGNPQLTFNRLMGNRPVSPATFCDFDVKNFKLLTGTPEAPFVQLDMPLQVNACDDSVEENHGETFNMPLPSCPP